MILRVSFVYFLLHAFFVCSSDQSNTVGIRLWSRRKIWLDENKHQKETESTLPVVKKPRVKDTPKEFADIAEAIDNNYQQEAVKKNKANCNNDIITEVIHTGMHIEPKPCRFIFVNGVKPQPEEFTFSDEHIQASNMRILAKKEQELLQLIVQKNSSAV